MPSDRGGATRPDVLQRDSALASREHRVRRVAVARWLAAGVGTVGRTDAAPRRPSAPQGRDGYHGNTQYLGMWPSAVRAALDTVGPARGRPRRAAAIEERAVATPQAPTDAEIKDFLGRLK